MVNENVTAIGTGVTWWAVMGAEAVQVLTDLRWIIVFVFSLIIVDFWWGVKELRMKYAEAETKAEKEKYHFRLSYAGRRTLNKFVDYLTWTLVSCIAGIAVTEPLGICSHTTTAAVGIGFACLFELSSITGHIAACNGIRIRFSLKDLLVALTRAKSEQLGDVLDQGIEEIDDGTRDHHQQHYDYEHKRKKPKKV